MMVVLLLDMSHNSSMKRSWLVKLLVTIIFFLTAGGALEVRAALVVGPAPAAGRTLRSQNSIAAGGKSLVSAQRRRRGGALVVTSSGEKNAVSSSTVVFSALLEDQHDHSGTTTFTSSNNNRHNNHHRSNNRTITTTVDRFHRQASDQVAADAPCVLTIDGNRYNVTAWANAHPGGPAILHKFHGDGRDASKAFAAVRHSAEAYRLLRTFLVVVPDDECNTAATTLQEHEQQPQQQHEPQQPQPQPQPPANHHQRISSRIRHKLFTKEDPIGVHKYLGVFCLVNFIRAYYQMYFGDPTAGLGRRSLVQYGGSRYASWLTVASLLPHGLLSLSSLLFTTVPHERVVKKPMIWQEYRAHNIIFGVRSVLTALAATWAARHYAGHHQYVGGGGSRMVRRYAVTFSGACVLVALVLADITTQKLRVVAVESTTATMPYWEGCSVTTQKRFKRFYAYCQFMATLVCLVSITCQSVYTLFVCVCVDHSRPLCFFGKTLEIGRIQPRVAVCSFICDTAGEPVNDIGPQGTVEHQGITLLVHGLVGGSLVGRPASHGFDEKCRVSGHGRFGISTIYAASSRGGQVLPVGAGGPAPYLVR
jgi:cytochrome b involved in lipid metabolism